MMAFPPFHIRRRLIAIAAIIFTAEFGFVPPPLHAQLSRVTNTTLNLPADISTAVYSTENAFPGLDFFSQPVVITTPPGEINRLFVVEKRGRIRIIPDLSNPVMGTFLDIRSQVLTIGEQGLLGLAFHPNYNNAGQPGHGEFFVYYQTDIGGQRHWRVSRFNVSAGDPNVADAGSEQPLISQLDEIDNHNGGDLHFGDDGYLYIAVGDEGGAADSFDNGQRIDKDFFAAIFRIDVDSKAANLAPNSHAAVHAGTYKVPADNPFVGATSFSGVAVDPADVRTEIWAIGMRNPWRMSFDRPTGRLFVGDVGQWRLEEINILSPAVFATNGGIPNYGWSFREGFDPFTVGPGGANPPAGFTAIDPIHDYPRDEGQSVTGGLVYRGSNYPELTGDYLFADYLSGRIWAMDDPGGPNQAVTEIALETGIVAFGIHPATGEVLLGDFNNHRVKRLVRSGGGSGPPPQFLSQTGAFSDLENLTPNPGIVPYDINLPFWSDHAVKTRWFSIPDVADDMTWDGDGNWTFPEGQVWIKHFELDLDRDNPGTNVRRLETRFLVRTAEDVYGITYRWNAAQTDAELVDESGLTEDFTITEGGAQITQTWEYPSRADCRTCHNPTAGLALGFNTRQLNSDFTHGAATENQISSLENAGYFTNDPPDPATLPMFYEADDPNASVEDRARSFLAVNCVQCHQPGGAAQGNWDARPEISLAGAGIIDGPLVNNGGNPASRVIAPGSVVNSMIVQRLEAVEDGGGLPAMPPLASGVKNQEAIDLLIDWIGEPQPVDPPDGITATDGTFDDRVAVSWNSVAGVSEYRIFRSTADDSGSASQIGTIAATTFDDTTAVPGTVYFYWVKAANALHQSSFSQSDPGRRAIAAPTSLTASDGTFPDRVQVDWAAVHAQLTYELFRNTVDNSATAAVLTTTAATSFNDATADPGETYFYWVRGRNGSETGSFGVSDSGFKQVSSPSGITTTDGVGGVRINWNAVPSAAEYHVYRGTGSDPLVSTPIGTVGAGTTTFTDGTGDAGTVYFYFLRTFAGDVLSDYTAGVAGKRLYPPPDTVAATDNFYDDKIRISWADVAGALEYIVYRNTVATETGAVEVSRPSAGTHQFDDESATPGATFFYSVRAVMTDGEESAFSDWVEGERSAAITFRPDEAIGRSASSHKGNGIYNTGAVGQTVQIRSKRRRILRFFLVVENDGVNADEITVSGTGGTRIFRATYFSRREGGERRNITGATVAGIYQVALDAAARSVLELETKRKGRKTRRLKGKTFIIIGISGHAPERRDAVKGKVRSG